MSLRLNPDRLPTYGGRVFGASACEAECCIMGDANSSQRHFRIRADLSPTSQASGQSTVSLSQ